MDYKEINIFGYSVDKLAEYENTGLEPKEVVELKEYKNMYVKLKKKYDELLCDKRVDKFCEVMDNSDIIEKLQVENKELKEQLQNAIVPKFKRYQEIYQIVDDEISGGYEIHKDIITYIECINGVIGYYTNYWGSSVPVGYKEQSLYETRQEAELALKELKGSE